MRKSIRKIMSLALAVCLVLGVLAFTPAEARASQITTQLNFVNTITTSSSGDGWAWDQPNKILTLTGLDLLYSGPNAHAIYLPGGSKIILNGINSIAHSDGGRAIECRNGDLAIEGPGSVDIISSKPSMFAYGIFIEDSGDLTIGGGAKVTITAEAGGIYTRSGGLTVNGDAELTTGDIDSNSDIIIDNAKVDAYIHSMAGSVIISGNAEVATPCIEVSKNVTISGGEVNCTGVIDAGNIITISGGVVNVTADYEGLFANDIVISGGSGTIKTSDTSGDYPAVAAWSGTITLGSGMSVKGWDGSAYTVAGTVGSFTDSWSNTYTTFLDAANPGVPLVNLQFGAGSTAAPVLTAGLVSRTSDANAAVKFTSNTAGTYYYQVDGTAPASVAALVAAGTNAKILTIAEQTLTLNNLTSGVRTIYIAAKDAAGNVSNLLTISIPAYVVSNPHTLIFDVIDGKFYEDTDDDGYLGLGDTVYAGQSGAWSWNGATGTLTLNGFVWVTSTQFALIVVNGDLTINLASGSVNTFRSTTDKPNVVSVGIAVLYDITIDGSGVLNAIGGNPTETDSASYGLVVDGGELTVKGGTLNATGGNLEAGSCGLQTGIFTLTGGTVNATGGTARWSSVGMIHWQGGSITGGTLNATGIAGSMVNTCYGIAGSGNSLTFTRGTVVAIGKDGAFYDAPVVNAAPYLYWTNPAAVDPGGKPTLSTDTPYSYKASDRYVKLTTDPVAYVNDATIAGKVGTTLIKQTIVITLYLDTIATGGMSNVNAASWFSNLPAGVTATASGTSGGNSITITFGGTPTAVSSAALNITIPASALTSGASLGVTANPNAKFAIIAGGSTALPKTGDTGNMMLWLTLGMLSIGGLCVLVCRKSRLMRHIR